MQNKLEKALLKHHPKCRLFWEIIQQTGPHALRLSSLPNRDGTPQFEIINLVLITDKMSLAFAKTYSDTPRDILRSEQIMGAGGPGVREVLVGQDGKILDGNRWLKSIAHSHVSQQVRVRLGAEKIRGNSTKPNK